MLPKYSVRVCFVFFCIFAMFFLIGFVHLFCFFSHILSICVVVFFTIFVHLFCLFSQTFCLLVLSFLTFFVYLFCFFSQFLSICSVFFSDTNCFYSSQAAEILNMKTWESSKMHSAYTDKTPETILTYWDENGAR